MIWKDVAVTTCSRQWEGTTALSAELHIVSVCFRQAYRQVEPLYSPKGECLHQHIASSPWPSRSLFPHNS